MKITQEENNILLNELVKEINDTPHLDPLHEITVEMLVKQTGLQENKARRILNNKVAGNGWKKHLAFKDDGNQCFAYFDPSKWNPANE